MNQLYQQHEPNDYAVKPRRAKQKIEKSNDEFKEHERITMERRIAEINNVITKVEF